MARLLVIPLALLALLLAAMSWSGSSATDRADFAFINRGDNKCLDPNGMSWMQDIRLAYALWEGLYTLDAQTLKPILGCAESVDSSPDHRVYTFHLRPSAKWSNGNPLRAQDFVFSWRRMLETPGEYTSLHYYIVGAQRYSESFADFVAKKTNVAPDFATVGEKALDDRTFQVTLIHPVTFFPALCAFPPFFPLHEESMKEFRNRDPKTGQISFPVTYDLKFTRPPYLVTNGPYRMAEWTFKRRLRMVANEYYWDRGNVKARTIDQVYDEEPLAAFRLYEQGDVDWIADVDPEIAAALMAKGGRSDLHVFPAFGTYFYEFNCQPKLSDGRANPLADVRVRRALAMAIDKQPIVRDVGRLGQPITTQYIPPNVFPGDVSPPGLPYDLTRARQLLADAGYPGGTGFPHLSILFNSEGPHGDIATIIRRQWLDGLGIDVDLENVEVKVFGARKHSHDFMVSRAGWYGDYDDPSTFTDKYKSVSDNNDAGWVNKEYDDLCAAMDVEPDPAKRLVLVNKAENLILEEAPIVPLYTYVGAYLYHDNVRGIALDPKQMVMFKAIEVRR
jgi:oligopeptide transport system substrate-binding protein